MGGFKHNEAKSQYGGRLGKINTPLDEKLKSVKWGEYKLGELFEVLSYKKRFDANKVLLCESNGHPYIVRQSTDNGQKGFICEDEQYLNDGNTISFGQDTATMFYQEKPYFTGDKIKILKPKFSHFNKQNAQFFLTAMKRAFSGFTWGTQSFSIDVIKNEVIQLPQTRNHNIDFAFMEDFVRELEESRLRELEAYLLATGLSNYKLSPKEQSVINRLSSQKWKEFDVTKVFNVCNTHNILSSEIKPDSGIIPYLCASSENNGVSSYISHDKCLIEKGNCVFIGGKTFVVSYQKTDFFSNDSHNLALYLMNYAPTKANQLYLACCIAKSLGYKYSWGDSISKAKIKNDKITLPEKCGKPDFETMEILIGAVQKLVIKDVVLYADRRLAATKQAINR